VEMHRWIAEIASLAERLARAEERLAKLEAEAEEWKRRPTHAVEKIEYRFDQLKIDTLQGTLHIGIRPEQAGAEPIWSLGEAELPTPNVVPAADPIGAAPPPAAPPPSPFLNIQRAVREYLHNAVPPLLAGLCEAAEYELEPEEVDRVVADLAAQVDGRIQYYMKLSELDPSRDPAAFEGSVADRTIRDVEAALRSFVAGKRTHSARKEELET